MNPAQVHVVKKNIWDCG